MKPARIIVLAIAIVAGGIAAFLAGRSEPPPPAPAPVASLETTDVLVAASDIGLGNKVSPQELRWQTWPAVAAGANFVRKSERPDAINQLAGSIARAPFAAGEPIREAKLIKGPSSGYMAAILPEGMRAISVEISPETGAGGFILPNDHVMSFSRAATRRRRRRPAPRFTSARSSSITCACCCRSTRPWKRRTAVVGKTATLELSPRQAETLALARQQGTLSLALRSLVDFNGKDKPVEDDSRRGSVNVVRFGITTTMTTNK